MTENSCISLSVKQVFDKLAVRPQSVASMSPSKASQRIKTFMPKRPAAHDLYLKSATHERINTYTAIRFVVALRCMEAIFNCDQAALWMVQSVRLSVCPSVRVITSDRSDVHAKGQGQRSKVKVTEVTTQLNRFRTVTPVWIHTWWWNGTYSLMLLRRGALLFLKVIRQISRSHGAKTRRIWPRLGVSGL